MFAVLLAAAGQSRRFQDSTATPQDVRKPFVELAGKPVWVHSAERFSKREDVSQVVLVISPEDDWIRTQHADWLAGVDIVHGGQTRAESVGNGLGAVRNASYVAVHDAARPLIESHVIDVVFEAAQQTGAAIPGTRVASTVKRVETGQRADADLIAETVPRDDLWLAQTPQVARRDWFEAAYANDAVWRPTAPTDEAQLLERAGHPVTIVESSPRNFKITTHEDLVLADALLRSPHL